MRKQLTILVLAAATALAEPPAPPGFSPAATLTNSAALAVAVLPAPPATNALPFRLLTRESGGWTLLSVATVTNVMSCWIVMSTNADFATTNAELLLRFSTWPQTQHVPGWNLNDGASLFGPPPRMFYKVYQMR